MQKQSIVIEKQFPSGCWELMESFSILSFAEKKLRYLNDNADGVVFRITITTYFEPEVKYIY